MTRPSSDAWESVGVDPDPEDDLGYEYKPLTVIRSAANDDQFIFLPGEEDHLTDSEFIIADANCVKSLEEWR